MVITAFQNNRLVNLSDLKKIASKDLYNLRRNPWWGKSGVTTDPALALLGILPL